MTSFRIERLNLEQCLPLPAGRDGEDPCRIELCLAEDKQDPVCLNVKRAGEQFEPADEAGIGAITELKKKKPSFNLASKPFTDRILLESVFSRELPPAIVEKWGPAAETGAFLAKLKLFLSVAEVNPADPVYAPLRRDTVAQLLVARERYPEFSKSWKELGAFLLEHPELSSSAKERIQLSLDAMALEEEFETHFAAYTSKDSEFKAALKKITGQLVPYTYGSGEAKELDSDEIYAACRIFYKKFPEKEEYQGQILFSGFYRIVENFEETHLKKPFQEPFKKRLNEGVGIYGAGLWEEWIPLLLMSETEYEKAFEISLALPYKWDPAKEKVMLALTDHLRVHKDARGNPVYQIDMEGVSKRIRQEATGEIRAKLLAATAEILISLFNPQTKLRLFWNGRYRELPALASTLREPSNRKAWEDLLAWVQTQAQPREEASAPWHPIGMGFDGGITALGAAGLISGLFIQDPNWSQGAATVMGAGLGGMIGNATCWMLDKPDSYFLCDLGGALAGGSAGFLIAWGINSLSPTQIPPPPNNPPPPPPPPPPDPGDRNPIDEFGP